LKQINAGTPQKLIANEFQRQLFNLQDDPGETKDVSADHPEVVKELEMLLNPLPRHRPQPLREGPRITRMGTDRDFLPSVAHP